MTVIRRRQFWIAVHRYTGLAVLALLFVAGLTGCMLCFEKPLDRLLNPALFRPAAAGLADPLAAVAALERARPALVASYFPVHAVPGRNILVRVEPRPGRPAPGYDEIFLDGGDGHVVAERASVPGWDRAHLMRGIYLLHSTLLAGTVGRWLMGIAAAVWLATSLVGAYITLPLVPPYLRRWRRAWTMRPSRSPHRLLMDLHRTSGLWLLLPLAVLAFTSVAMNFFEELLIPVVQHVAPPRPSPFDGPPPRHPAPRGIALADLVADAGRLARERGLGWRPAIVQQEPDRGLLGVRFTRSGQEEYRLLGPVTYWFDGRGRFVYEDSPYADSAGMKLQRSLYPLHTGEVIGGMGVALDVLLGAATVLLSASGFYFWLRRRAVQRHGRARAAAAGPA